jgi:hypothetical protein
MTLAGAIAGGFIGTIVLTTIMSAATELKLTRMDLPFLLGTALTERRARAKALGYAAHFLAGLGFATLYWLVLTALGAAGWLPGLLLGALHGAFAGTALVNLLLPLVHPRMGSAASSARRPALIEPPGFMMLNYGVATPIVALLAHLAYGAIVGWFMALSGGS